MEGLVTNHQSFSAAGLGMAARIRQEGRVALRAKTVATGFNLQYIFGPSLSTMFGLFLTR